MTTPSELAHEADIAAWFGATAERVIAWWH